MSDVTETRNDEVGFVEFLNEDVPYIVRELGGPAAILLDVQTRKVIGYRVYDPDGAALSGTREAVEPVAWQHRFRTMRHGTRSQWSEWLPGMADRQHEGTLHEYEDRPLYAAPPSDPVGQGAVTVPQAAIDWLMGAGPDEDGHYFGDSPKDNIRGAFWWRSRFRSMFAISPAPEAGSDEVERLRADREKFLREAGHYFAKTCAMAAEITALRDQLGKMREALADLKNTILLCEKGATIYDVLSNYRAVRRTLQDDHATLANTDKEAGR